VHTVILTSQYRVFLPCSSRTILEQYLKHSVELIEPNRSRGRACIFRQCQTHFHLAHYTDGLFKSYEERLASSEWQAAMRLRKHKVLHTGLRIHVYLPIIGHS